MSTYNDLKIGNDWVDVFTALGITIGKKSLILQNKGSTPLTLSLTASAPSGIEGTYLSVNERIIIPLGVQGLFVRANGAVDTSSRLAIEDAGVIQTSSSLPADLFTEDVYGIRRLAVDSQQTSFEANQQYRFVDEFIDVPAATSILYKLDLGIGITLFERTLEVISGGRKYYVYPYNPLDTYVGTEFWAEGEERIPSPMNYILRDGLLVHPASQLTFTRYHVTSFTPVEDWLDLSLVNTAGNNNRSTSEFTSSDIRFGGASGTVLWVYMPAVPSNNNNTNGMVRLVWEERTNLS
ncbi:hypothetical protein VPHG_00131 [Vibrio phage 11895-B1]|uniref:hypothetical protein n=1 Tax=Vibrio phage 11895-B1 TaxID=754075 RepID=UPI0002C0F159|nr:hypothetical protein VPHG_00131 [Vibrio phage 11895-B1]AGH32197.1 hypothetical protein VPHG_00131 [Vibrio phage 11895-B1]